MAILAAGVGFGIRNGILDNWGREFGFTAGQTGKITGMGFTGFCFGIVIGGVIADKIGYGKLVIAAFLLHVISALVTFGAVAGVGQSTAYNFLFWGAFLFSFANGALEAVANPLVATLFPHNRTHYLNILHASWPAGLVLGGIASWVLDDRLALDWRYQFAIFLVPTLIYGLMFLGQAMPKSEASQKGLTLADMFKDVGILGGLVVCYLLGLFFASVLEPILTPAKATPEQVASAATTASYIGYGIGGALLLGIAIITRFSIGSFLLFILFVAHAMVGAVELGTDNWVVNITGNILSSPESKILFVFTSMVMFVLRFCADFIEKKLGLSPVAILLICAVLACIGLNLTSMVDSFFMAMLALTVYGIGKTFFWPTMLAVASDRFPRTGAIAISFMGGIGMMSAGLVGAPGLGYFKDKYAGEALQRADEQLFDKYKADKPTKFLMLPEETGLDGKKLAPYQEKLTAARNEVANTRGGDPRKALERLTEEERTVHAATIEGDRKTLRADSAIPAAMAVIYLGLLIYFAAIGGYKPVHIGEVKNSGGH